MDCPVCDATFSAVKNLRKHVKAKHPEKDVDAIAPTPKSFKLYNFECALCGKHFSNEAKLRSHTKLQHSGYEKSNDCETFMHSNFKEFLAWKAKIEKETNSFFKKKSHVTKGEKVFHYFICHRSGTFVSRGSGIRQMKRKGSCKINGICPAKIKVIVSEIQVKTTFYPYHEGHSTEFEDKFPCNRVSNKVQTSLKSTGCRIINLIKVNLLQSTNQQLTPDENQCELGSNDQNCLVNYNVETNYNNESNDQLVTQYNQENNDNIVDNNEENCKDHIGDNNEQVTIKIENDYSEEYIDHIVDDSEQNKMKNKKGYNEKNVNPIVDVIDQNVCQNENSNDLADYNEYKNLKKEECKKQFLTLLDSVRTTKEIAIIKKGIQIAETCLSNSNDKREASPFQYSDSSKKPQLKIFLLNPPSKS